MANKANALEQRGEKKKMRRADRKKSERARAEEIYEQQIKHIHMN